MGTNAAPSTFSLALIGAGRAGRALAAAAVRAGHRVLLEDVMPARLREALDEIPTKGMPGSLETVSTVEDAVREADLAIDFVPDELESKLEIVCMVDRMAPPRTVLCIQTRALSVTDLASCTYRGDRCVGLVFDGGTALVTRGAATSQETLRMVEGFAKSLGVAVTIQSETS